ncbi:MAG: hypothetical protein HYV36_06465 [Lentisphaerae bacterium]|nr:hypothetical protein [Lentisphaerota bacterium]
MGCGHSPHWKEKAKIAKSSYHLSGIAGAGMNALAQVLLAQGCRVSGSDRHLDSGRTLEVLEKLRASGVTLTPQDGSGVTAGLTGLVISAAIEADNPDIAAARQWRVPVFQRAECLARLTNARRCIAVTGTSGKTTVTSKTPPWLMAARYLTG